MGETRRHLWPSLGEGRVRQESIGSLMSADAASSLGKRENEGKGNLRFKIAASLKISPHAHLQQPSPYHAPGCILLTKSPLSV
jgi:hypothetical protein